MNIESLKGYSKEMKVLLLRVLDYDSDGTYVINKRGERILDRYSHEAVRLDNMAILPSKKGAIIIDCNPLSFCSYLEEFNIS